MFDQLSPETDIDEIIDFDFEVVTSLSAIDPLVVDWRQEPRNKSIAEVMERSDPAIEEANQSEEETEIVTDEDEIRKITAAEALNPLVPGVN